jgi:hypothetical protein
MWVPQASEALHSMLEMFSLPIKMHTRMTYEYASLMSSVIVLYDMVALGFLGFKNLSARP